jgi:hypothetical protein
MFTRAARGHRYLRSSLPAPQGVRVIKRKSETPTTNADESLVRPTARAARSRSIDRMKRFETTSLASRTFEAFFLLLARTWHLSPILRALT